MTHALIVDDKPENLYLLRVLLQGHGWVVEEASNGAEALAKARQDPPDLIISDLLMPVMDGYTLLREWRSDERLQAIPFVVYTATYTEPKDERLALNLGAAAFIIKPLEPEPFMERIQEVLAKKDTGVLRTSPKPTQDAIGLLKEYSEVLVNKLEAKVSELEQANQGLQKEIARRQQIETELTQSRQDWEDIFEAIGHPTIIMDMEHGIVAANKECIEVTGKSLDELLHARCYEVFHLHSQRPQICPMEALLESGGREKIEAEVESLGGNYLVSCTPILDAEGNVKRIIHTATDISERKKAEEGLRESEEKLKTISSSVQDAIIVINDRGDISFWNPGAERMFGYPVSEALQKNVHELLAPLKYREDYRTGFREFARTGQGAAVGRTLELEGIHKNGDTIPIELSLSSFRMDGKWHAVGSVRDITERKRSEERRLRFLERQERINGLLRMLIEPGDLVKKLKGVTDGVVDIFGADFCRIWRISKGDRCDRGCPHAAETEDIHACKFRDKCLHLLASSGRYSHTDGLMHRRVPFGVYKIGRLASEQESKFLTNDVVNDPTVHNHDWARELGLVSFAGYQVRPLTGETLGVLALFSKHAISEEEDAQLETLSSVVAQVFLAAEAEDTIRQSEARLREAQKLAKIGNWELDLVNNKLIWSEEIYRIFEIDPGDFGASYEAFLSCIHPEDRKAVDKAYTDSVASKTPYNISHRLKLQNGRIKYVHEQCKTYYDEAGKPVRSVGTVQDVTDRKRSEESQKLLAAVVEHASESIVVTDTQGAIQYVNPAFELATGYAKDKAIGLNPRLLKSGKHDDRFYEGLWKTITQGNVWHGHFINKKRNGALFEEDATIFPLKDARGNVINYVAVKRDVTKEVSLQRQLFQSQKLEAIGTLAGGIAHDFNNILFGISGYAELAMEQQPKKSQSRVYLERVMAASKRAGDMVQQILLFSRRGEFEKKLLDLTPIVKEGLKFLRGSIPSTIEIRQQIGTSLGKVEADPTQIHQVLMNLCANSAHAMKETQGVLTVELSEMTLDADFSARHLSLIPGKYIKLTVSDTGHGIAPDVIDHIFEPYFTTKKVGEGTGLGLSVIHGIIASHGGTITVYSVPGEGSTFSVFLPVVEGQDGWKAESKLEVSPTGQERILYVDDEQLLVEMGDTMLKRLGYEVVSTTDPTVALELFRSDPSGFDLLFTDLVMPKMTGTDLAAEIRALRADMPIILCTGFGHKFTYEEANQRGFQAVIKKPISKKDVAQTIRRVLDRKE